MLTGTVGGHQRRKLTVGGGVAGPGVGPRAEEQRRGFIDRAAPRIELASFVTLGAAVGGAGGAELPEGDRVAPGLGEEVAA